MKRTITVFLAVFIALHVNSQNADIRILRNINHPVNPGLDRSMLVVSQSVPVLSIGIPLTAMYFDYRHDRHLFAHVNGLTIAGALGGSFAICYGLKLIVNRPRPFVTYSDITQRDFSVGPYSFPSGHTSTAFALATSVSLCYRKWYYVAPAYLWAGTVAYSRMRLGVHYPSDVFAGALVGTGSAFVSWYIMKWFQHRYQEKERLKHIDVDPLPG